jgi:Ca2+-transporting ATPase
MNSKALRRDICVKVCGREAMMQEKSKEQGNGQKRGYNLLDKEEQKSMLSCFVEQLCDPLIFILFAAAAISLSMKLLLKIAIMDVYKIFWTIET